MTISDKKGWCTFFVALVFSVTCFCVHEAYGGNAWYKTSWGMSPDEVRKVMGKQMEVLSDGTLMLRGYDILGKQYDVAFAFGEKKGLCYVVLNCRSSQYGCFLQLEKALKAKYGQSKITKSEKERAYYKEETTYEWYTKDTHITMEYAELQDPASKEWKINKFCWAKYESRNVDEKF